MTQVQTVMAVVGTGIGATMAMDAWLVLLKKAGVPTQGFGMIGRWVGHMAHGRFTHAAIAKAAPIRGELALGWVTHYAVGVLFAALLVSMTGGQWLMQPTFLPAIAFGVGSVAAPMWVMQPAMGAGFAASRTPKPAQNRLRSLANHTVFGIGLYAAARLIAVFIH